ncbi:chromatin-binding exonuclease [Saccharomycopsis crataegensis]|uniref:5'-3' exoribonuclease 1 n=1 Tax=Saccharomycopsis crataegensis TaxID=43959 RepID=A0AAV5QQC8_9ASCO|nr:chromatin-binding exonuclease [Saccharomycopsis crataegensis]
MGVPKFFRFISERWPLISKLIDEDQIPEFDNLYLDMNSILHNCTRATGQKHDDLTESISDDEMYTAIFAYIDHLFNTIKPKKVFYMAIDGVAPRAKMNQQRSRRFRTALEAEKERKRQQEEDDLKGIDSGIDKKKDPSQMFDSNSITPGTEFMAKVSKHIKFFIHKKVSTDANWQNIDVIFSGHEVPGEGEHKIMKYIRTMKSQSDYDPNLRHCIYGLDADLIMLGLVTHEPHFSLLREEVTFGPQRKDKNKGGSTVESLENERFYLLHLSLVREYLELEFSDLQNILKFNYSFERILDDFILIMYVLGNDFLPHLPDLHINKGAFPLLLKTFKKFLINSDGYLNDCGTIDFGRLKIWLDYLSLFEYENYENGNVDIEWFNKKLDNLSLDNENKKKLMELKRKRFEEQTKKSSKAAERKRNEILSKDKGPSNAFSNLEDEVENDDEDVINVVDKKLEEFHQIDESLDNAFSKIFAFTEPWLINIYSSDASRIDPDIISEDDIPILDISNLLVPDNGSLQFDFLKQIAHDFDLIVVQDQELGKISLKLDISGIEPNETDEEYQERISSYNHIIEKYASRFSNVTLAEIEKLNKEFEDSMHHDSQFSNLSNFLEDENFVAWKNQYYQAKFGFTLNDSEKFGKLAHNYLEGLQWVLYYYYKGCPSWSWYYQYYFSPRISDIAVGISDAFKVEFPKDVPFKPFQQLMGVLPARSNTLLPKVYRPLMLEPNSPIIDFYPSEVEIDKNGKTAEWEYVFKLSFVDETRLLEAMKPYDSKLTAEEKARNSYGFDLIYRYNPQVDKFYKSSLPHSFKDLEHDNCIELPYELPLIDGEVKKSRDDDDYYSENMDSKPFNHLCRGAKIGVSSLANFPSLKTLPFTSGLAIDYLVIFNQPSRSESMILNLQNPHEELLEELTIEDIAKKYLNQIVYVSWPYLKEAKVISISDGLLSYELDSNGRVSQQPLGPSDATSFGDRAKSMIQSYHISKGLKIGKVNLVFTTVSTNGLIRNKKGAYVKTFAKKREEYPFQLVVDSVVNPDKRFKEREAKPIDKEFPVDSKVTFLGDIAYGNEATVVGYKSNTELILQVSKVTKNEEPNFGANKAYQERHSVHFFNSNETASKLGIHPIFLSKITSSFLIENVKGRRVNIGLDLKFEGKKLKVLGYTKRNERGWLYSSFAIELIREYKDLFPTFFRNLANCSKNHKSRNLLHIQDLYPKIPDPLKLDETLGKVSTFLDSKKARFNTTSLGSESLNRSNISEIEQFTIQYISRPHNEITRNLKGVPLEAILDNQNSQQLLKKQYFNLGDRVSNVLDGTKVPLFAKGTVVGINVSDEKVTLNIVFDYPLINGNSLNGRLRSTRGLVVDSSHLLNLTHKQFIYHSKSSLERSKYKQSERSGPKPVSKPKVSEKKEKELSKEEKEQIERETKEKAASKRELLSLLKKSEANQGNDTESENNNEQAPTESTTTAAPAPVAAPSTRNIDNDKAAKEVYGAIMSGILKNGSAPAPTSLPPPVFNQSSAPQNFFQSPGGFVPGPGFMNVPPPGAFPPPPPQFFQNPPVMADREASSELKTLLKGPDAKYQTSQALPDNQSLNKPNSTGNKNGRQSNRNNNRGRGGMRGRGRGRGGNRGGSQNGKPLQRTQQQE